MPATKILSMGFAFRELTAGRAKAEENKINGKDKRSFLKTIALTNASEPTFASRFF